MPSPPFSRLLAQPLLDLLGVLSEGLADAIDERPLIGRVMSGSDVLTMSDIVDLPSSAALRAELTERLSAGQEAGLVRASLDPAVAALGFETVVLDQVARIVKGAPPGTGAKDERWIAVVSLLEAALVP